MGWSKEKKKRQKHKIQVVTVFKTKTTTKKHFIALSLFAGQKEGLNNSDAVQKCSEMY